MGDDDKTIEEIINELANDPGVFTYDPNLTVTDSSKWRISPAMAGDESSWSVVFDEYSTDISYNLKPEQGVPEVYTSQDQRDRHDKYPALQKAWEDYIALFALSKGEPPIVE